MSGSSGTAATLGPDAGRTCPPEIVMLLDHVMEAGVPLRQWVYGVDGVVAAKGSDFVRPVLAGGRVVEGATFAELARPTWTVDVAVPTEDEGALLEFREDERRWVGFHYGADLIWRRFYEGPTL